MMHAKAENRFPKQGLNVHVFYYDVAYRKTFDEYLNVSFEIINEGLNLLKKHLDIIIKGKGGAGKGRNKEKILISDREVPFFGRISYSCNSFPKRGLGVYEK